MIIRKLEVSDLDRILEILNQDSLRGYNGQLPVSQSPWIKHFLEDNCFAFGLELQSQIQSVILAEKLTYNGCIVWYIATSPEHQSSGLATQLLQWFENWLKSIDITWIFLNSSEVSLDFYKNRGYITSQYSKVWEHVKEF
jgi:GNAT superfamily N-acetyltransferase